MKSSFLDSKFRMASQVLKMSVIAQTNPKHSATMIIMHGSGGTGLMTRENIKMVLGHHLSFPHIRILYPTAPLRPYTPSAGQMENVWFDRRMLAQDVPEDIITIEHMAKGINQLIDDEVKQGVSSKRILLGGFSMGGSMALQMGYRFCPDVGGIFALSSFLNTGSKVYEALGSSPDTPRPPLFMCHGEKDDLVSYAWGHNTFLELQKHHVQGHFHSFPNMEHDINKKEILMLQEWISQQLPDV